MSPTFFTDRDLGKQFPEVLRAAGLSVARHADHFAPDAPDEDWLRLAGQRRWTAITHDGRIRYKPNELAAVVRHSVGLLVVVGHAPYGQLAHNFVATLHKIERFIAAQAPPFIARVYRPSPADLARNPRAAGTVALWYPN